MEGNGKSHGFEIETVSTRSTGIQQLDLIKLDKIFPIVIVTLNALVLGHAGALGMRIVVEGVVDFRTTQVHVLAVDGNSALGEHLCDLGLEPCSALVVADVELAVVRNIGVLIGRLVCLAVAYKPFGLDAGIGKRLAVGIGHTHALGLEPKQRLNAVFVGGFGNFAEFVGETLGVGSPVTGISPILGAV